MGNPSSQPPKANADDVGAQGQVESMDGHIGSIDLSDPQSNTMSQEPKITKGTARDLLKRLEKRRLEVTRITFTAGGTQAGKGSHGEVVVANLTLVDCTSSEPASQVAVKKLLVGDDINEEKLLRAFANELGIVDRLDHPNIIKLVGFVEDMKKGMAWLVFPWESNGNVREFLLSGKWELPERVSLIKDVASGLEYLHTRQPPIRHGDLKSLNILVNSYHRAVITDFGSARIQSEARGFETTSSSPHRQTAFIDSNLTMHDAGSPEVTVSVSNAELTLTGPSWSFRWAAPEILNEEEPCLASDIWALGWIAWEIVTDNYPFPEVKTSKLITVKVIKGLLPLLYNDDQLSQIGRLCDVMVRCWKPEPKERMSAAECRSTLQWLPSSIPRAGSDGASHIRSTALLLEMGEMHRFQSKYKEALNHFEDAFQIARSAGDKETMARALELGANIHGVMYDHDKAEEACNEALAIYTSIGNIFGRANTFYSLGKVHELRGDLAKAEESFKQALPIYTIVSHSLGRANALWKLGEIYGERSNYSQAEESFNQALAIFVNIGDNLGRANVLRGLGEMHHAQSNHADADKYFSQALAIYASIGNSRGQANAFYGLGRTHRARANYADAEESFNQALVIYTKIGERLGRTNSLLGLGEAFLRQVRYSEAQSFLHEAAEASNKIDYDWAQTRSKELLAEILDAGKSPAEATL